jgi:hypothetical protein
VRPASADCVAATSASVVSRRAAYTPYTVPPSRKAGSSVASFSTEELAREALRLEAHKLPIATKFVTRAEQLAAAAAAEGASHED